MRFEIRPLDPADRTSVEEVFSLLTAAQKVDVPDFPPPCRHEFFGGLIHETSFQRVERYLAHDRAGGAGYLTMTLPLRDNLDNADVELTVQPGHRRRGIGRALHGHALARLRQLGRKRLSSPTVISLPGGPARPGSGAAFAAAMGARPALTEVRRRLDLTHADPEPAAELVTNAQAKAVDYQIASWRDQTPDRYLADAAYLEGRLISDSPMGQLDWEAQQIDAERLREQEGLYQAGRLRIYSTGAVHRESGKLVALTSIAGNHSTTWHAWQWITLVDPPHRGRRLGALIKLENLRYARAQQPELQVIDTWNAAENRHMIGINEAMGFRPVDNWINWQQSV